MEFNYYYGNQADMFSFIRIPKIMLTEESFSALSIPAKVLYGVLLDRMTLSRKNGWFDEENRVFIIYQIDEIREDLGFSKKKAMDLLSELENFGLLEKRRRGHGLPNILYVKSFMTGLDADVQAKEKSDARGSENRTSRAKSIDPRSAEIITSRSASLGTSKVSNSALQEVPISAPLKSNTEKNKNYRNNIESNHILSTGSDEIRCDEKSLTESEVYEQVIRENIGYEDLLISHPHDREMIEGMISLILETVISRGESFVIAGNRYPSAVVKSRFLKLDYSHIEYVLFCLKKNTTKINNIKKYLLAALFNAPSIIGSYYQAEVNHDAYGAVLNHNQGTSFLHDASSQYL